MYQQNTHDEASAIVNQNIGTSDLDDMEREFGDAVTEPDANEGEVLSLRDFIGEFGSELLAAVEQNNPPVYTGAVINPKRQCILNGLARKPFPAQAEAVYALSALLFDQNEKAAVLNAEMGTGKTMMSISMAAIALQEGLKRILVISPPHLVYKWRREIQETIKGARVWVLNGPDTLMRLLKLKSLLVTQADTVPEFFIIGRVRMRLGHHWRHACSWRQFRRVDRIDSTEDEDGYSLRGRSNRLVRSSVHPVCPRCFEWLRNDDGDLYTRELFFDSAKQRNCPKCHEPLWTLMRNHQVLDKTQLVKKALCDLPTIGPKSADKLIRCFGESMLESMLSDNIFEFVNLMDESGEFVFNDRQASRIEKAIAKMEFGFGQGGYQATEFIKRYLPKGFVDLLVVDEGHEYKNSDSAQGQAMGVLSALAKKVLVLTGTLMGGYASDLFYLLWRIMPARMIEMGYRCSANGSMASSALAFMRDHGVLVDVLKVRQGDNHKTARGKRQEVSTKKGPGFGPLGIAQCILPFTVFLKLKDIGQSVLPPYKEHFVGLQMTDAQGEHYKRLESVLTRELKAALRAGSNSLLGVVMNALLAWPDCCFREEVVRDPRTRKVIAQVPEVFDVVDPGPKEQWLQEYCVAQVQRGRRVLVYTSYTGKRDTTARLKALLSVSGIKVAVLQAAISTEKREDWIAEQVDRGVQVVICNPELVKTGLDLLEFPSIVFMQTGYNVYTLMQAARRSWRIGQREPVEVTFLGYEGTAQMQCLRLMSEKIAVSQSTAGDIPESGLDSLNQRGDSIEVALARELVVAA